MIGATVLGHMDSFLWSGIRLPLGILAKWSILADLFLAVIFI